MPEHQSFAEIDSATQPGMSAKRVHLGRVAAVVVLTVLGLYGLAAYGAIPAFWKSYESRHPALSLAQRRAFTAQGIPGDPINLAFVGQAGELMAALQKAGWVVADPITWRTSARIAFDSVAHRSYVSAPVSDLFVRAKKQDMAFEQAFGPDPSKRHHARFWKLDKLDDQGRPLWLGAATFDSRVGLSNRTGQVTHHIDADIDKERDKLANDLGDRAGVAIEWVDDFQSERQGKNGGGDRYFTDGRLCLAYVRQAGFLDSARNVTSTAAEWFNTVLQ